nr:DHHW family protein [uncultured Oscillibacter sp.]
MMHDGKRPKDALAAMVLALLLSLSAVNGKALAKPLYRMSQGEIGFEGFVDEVRSGYTANRSLSKNCFIDLNGLFARLTGRRVLNDVVRCDDGMLTQAVEEEDISDLAQNIVELASYLDGCEDIPFIYVQMPYKEDLEGELLPEGIESFANQNADRLLSILRDHGICCLDTRPWVCRTTEMIERYFYSTDHHWTAEGAFAAFREITAELQKMFPGANIELDHTREELWERHEKEDWMLGSRGKRVGRFFAGTDPLIWLTPRFETEMSCSVPSLGDLRKGDFNAANISSRHIDNGNFWSLNSYCVYIGSDHPLVQHRNLDACSNMKVLIIKDSFSLPLQTYLSTVFQEVDALDPRYFRECSIAEYIDWTQPDVVIYAINPDQFPDRSFRRFGVAGMRQALEQKGDYQVVEQGDIGLEARDVRYNYTGIPLEQGSVYKVTFDDVEILAGDTQGVGLRLCNTTTEKDIGNIIFDISYCRDKEGFTWTFRTPETDDELRLLFYAGIYGHTAGNRVVYRNVRLEKWAAA